MKSEFAKSINDTYTLSNGTKIPCLGFGTWIPNPEEAEEVITNALEAGYRLFDTASQYVSERSLGRVLRNSGLKRDEYFVSSKAWMDEMGYEETTKAIDRSLERLGMDYLDLYFVHWPRQPKGQPGFENWKELDIETWKALEDAHDAGKIKNLGISNFLPHHIENLLPHCRILPVINQLEMHTLCMQEYTLDYCRKLNIQIEASAPLGRTHAFENEFIQQLAAKYNVTIAQICVRYLLQRGILPLPKSTNRNRIFNNADVFNFEIEREDMLMLTCLPNTGWIGEHPDVAIPTVSCPRDQ